MKGLFLQQLLLIVGINCCAFISNIKASLREPQEELIFVSNFDEFLRALNFFLNTMKIGVGNVFTLAFSCMNTVLNTRLEPQMTVGFMTFPKLTKVLLTFFSLHTL